MSNGVNGEGFTTLEDVFTSRDFGRPAGAAAAAPVAKAAPRAVRAHLLTNRAIAILSVGAAALSVVATLAANAGGPSLAPVVSAQHAPAPPPDSLTPVPGGALGGLGTSGGGGSTTGSSNGGNGATGPSAGTTGGSPAGNGAAGGAPSGTVTVAVSYTHLRAHET